MKKFRFVILAVFSLVLINIFNPVDADAATKSNCSDSYVRCQAITIYQGDKSASSNTIYVPSGGSIYLSAQTYDDSLFQVGAYLYQGNTQIASVGAAGSGGMDWKTVTAPRSGYYHVVLRSGDDSQGRSHARAYLSYAYR